MIPLIIQNISKQYGEWDTKLKTDKNENKKPKQKTDYSQLKTKMLFQLLGMILVALLATYTIYKLIWHNQGGNWVVSMLWRYFGIDSNIGQYLYTKLFRNHTEFIWAATIIVIFLVLLVYLLNKFTAYFDLISQGIDALLNDKDEISLPAEMSAIERKLNMVRQTLQQRSMEAQTAEQRKNDLVMYLAHDIRTPLTSVIGYLSLLEEAPDMPIQQRAKYVHITLEKAYRLENMINEFFEITRYNLQHIVLNKETIDLYYMLVQLTDELSPVLAANGNTAVLRADENLSVYGDSDKLARVFNNVLKNAAAYSFPNTEILISAEEKDGKIIITFQNRGKTIPREKLSTIFEKFYRLDEARTSNTGGAGLGLAIAKEIVSLHGGTITANSERETISFIIRLLTS